MSVGWNGKALIATIREDSADGFFGIGESFLLGVALGHHLRERGNQYREAATFLWLQHDRKAKLVCHDIAPAPHMPLIVPNAAEGSMNPCLPLQTKPQTGLRTSGSQPVQALCAAALKTSSSCAIA